MSRDLEQLVVDAARLLNVEAPRVMSDSAPVPGPEQIAAGSTDGFYVIGLIGGKDVGKSSMVNALVGRDISEPSSHGRGTQQVIAYAHESQCGALREMLERDAPGSHRIVAHAEPALRQQVLLDLPDIDSHWREHVQLTRRMLRHMLFPIWIQSVEKYADQQPQQLLSQVAEGNDPRNFVFCLNKIDQLIAREGTSAVQELARDFAARLARTLGIAPPVVHAISATTPDRFDFPGLRAALSRQKSDETIVQSRHLAGRRRERSLLAWIDDQHLPERLDRLNRLYEQAKETCAARIASPLLEEAIPRLLNDPSHRGAITHAVMNRRIARWPIVNWLHTLLSPLLSAAAAPQRPGGEMLDRHLCVADSQPARSLVQRTFALLHQTQPLVGELYAGRKLWEEPQAMISEATLRAALAGALERQRESAVDRLAGSGPPLVGPLVRWILTVGAMLWFPLVQPLLRAYLEGGIDDWAVELVKLLGAASLLHSAGFLVIYLVFLWLALRWNTQRRVGRLLERWKKTDAEDPQVNLTAQLLTWADELLDPIRDACEQLDSLVRRADQLRHAARD